MMSEKESGENSCAIEWWKNGDLYGRAGEKNERVLVYTFP